MGSYELIPIEQPTKKEVIQGRYGKSWADIVKAGTDEREKESLECYKKYAVNLKEVEEVHSKKEEEERSEWHKANTNDGERSSRGEERHEGESGKQHSKLRCLPAEKAHSKEEEE